MDVPHYWTAEQVRRLLDALEGSNRDRARIAALIMWRAGLRISEALGLEWRHVDYSSENPSILIHSSKTARERRVPLHPELVDLFKSWPTEPSPGDLVVGLPMRTALRHIGDGFRLAGLDAESPGTGRRLAGAHSLRHSAAHHWLTNGNVPLHVISLWLGHSTVDVTVRMYLSRGTGRYTMDGIP